MKKTIRTVVLLIFLTGAVFCGYQIYSIWAEYHTSEVLYQDIQQYMTYQEETHPTKMLPTITETTPKAETQPQATEPQRVYPSIDFQALQQINKDTVAWICIEGTNINYPVVQGADNRHYVSTMIDGTPNGSGSIFLDYRNKPDFSDPHTILYGHNMQNGSMFHDICNYKDPDFYASYPTGLLMTPDGNYYFEIVSAYVASLADSAWQIEFVDDTDLYDWVSASVERSAFVSPIQPQPGDRIITLSTCSYEFNDARFVLVGILREE